MEDVIIRVIYRCWENASEKGSLIVLSFEGIITFLGIHWLHKDSASIKHFDSHAQGFMCRCRVTIHYADFSVPTPPQFTLSLSSSQPGRKHFKQEMV